MTQLCHEAALPGLSEDEGGPFTPRTPHTPRSCSPERGSFDGGSRRSSPDMSAYGRSRDDALQFLSASSEGSDAGASSVTGSVGERDVPGALAAAFFVALLLATTPRAALVAAVPLLLRLACLLGVAFLAAQRAVRLPLFARRAEAAAAPRSSTKDAMPALHVALALAQSESGMLRAGADAAMTLFPGAVACAFGAFAEGTAECECGAVSWLECGGDDVARSALAAALAAAAGGDAADAPSSVERACRQDGASGTVLDSRQLPGGLASCSDWAALADGSLAPGFAPAAAVAAKLVAGHVTVGFAQLYFAPGSARQPPRAEAAALADLAAAVAGALFVRRALAINREYEAAGAADGPNRRMSDPGYAADMAVDAAMEAAAVRNDAALLAQLDGSAAADAAMLLTWSLDPWALPDEEVQRLMLAMLHSVGALRRFQIRPTAAVAFLADVAVHYVANPFHDFRHAFMIQHVCWLFMSELSLRDGLLEELDVLALLLAAICHDLEHPGTTNAYQCNTGSALALRYNDTSVLENHHCAVGFQLLERSRLLDGLTDGEYKALRKLVVAAILSTDMSMHNELLAKVVLRATREAVRGAGAGGFSRASADDRSLLVSFLLHTADLCNPVLPPPLSYRIANQLAKEFARQAELEQAAGLPITVMISDTDVGKAKLELGFIGAKRVAANAQVTHLTQQTLPRRCCRLCGCAAVCDAGHHRAQHRSAVPASHQRQSRHVDAHHFSASAARAPLGGARRVRRGGADDRQDHRRAQRACEGDGRDCARRGSGHSLKGCWCGVRGRGDGARARGAPALHRQVRRRRQRQRLRRGRRCCHGAGRASARGRCHHRRQRQARRARRRCCSGGCGRSRCVCAAAVYAPSRADASACCHPVCSCALARCRHRCAGAVARRHGCCAGRAAAAGVAHAAG